VLGIGIWLQVSKGSYASIIPNVSFLGASVLCIVAGVLILIIGFFGCCGAIMESQCMLITVSVYSILTVGRLVSVTLCNKTCRFKAATIQIFVRGFNARRTGVTYYIYISQLSVVNVTKKIKCKIVKKNCKRILQTLYSYVCLSVCPSILLTIYCS